MQVSIERSDRLNREMEKLSRELDQLRHEAKIIRLPVSQSARDLMDFVEAERDQDVLVKGMQEAANPYRDKKSPCAVI